MTGIQNWRTREIENVSIPPHFEALIDLFVPTLEIIGGNFPGCGSICQEMSTLDDDHSYKFD